MKTISYKTLAEKTTIGALENHLNIEPYGVTTDWLAEHYLSLCASMTNGAYLKMAESHGVLLRSDGIKLQTHFNIPGLIETNDLILDDKLAGIRLSHFDLECVDQFNGLLRVLNDCVFTEA